MNGRKATTAAMKSGGTGGDTYAVDEVERLLQAAQDEILLNLSVDSHVSRSDHLLPSDLDSRFRALKSRPSATKSPAQSSSRKPQTQSPPPFSLGGQSDDDLFARFAALKASSSSNSSSAPPAANAGLGGFDRGGGGGGDDDVEDEVEKIIQWAKDAARLDPSPPSDDEDEDDDVDSDKYETDDDDDDNEEADVRKKGQQRK